MAVLKVAPAPPLPYIFSLSSAFHRRVRFSAQSSASAVHIVNSSLSRTAAGSVGHCFHLTKTDASIHPFKCPLTTSRQFSLTSKA